jgi:hypothetical protein
MWRSVVVSSERDQSAELFAAHDDLILYLLGVLQAAVLLKLRSHLSLNLFLGPLVRNTGAGLPKLPVEGERLLGEEEELERGEFHGI